MPLLLIVLLVSCSQEKYQIRDKSHGNTDRLNYDYTNRYYRTKVQKDHFTLALTVVSPVHLTFGQTEFDPVHLRAGAEGGAVVRIEVDRAGRVTSMQFEKRAGAGLDSYVEEIIQSSRFTPVRHRGEDQNSSFIIHVLVKEL